MEVTIPDEPIQSGLVGAELDQERVPQIEAISC
jgi:hypothetical protein